MKIIAHRSGPAVYPGQTILSARQARAYAELIEIDTRFTADDVIVICHDRTAERVFGDPRAIAELTAAEFLALRHRADPAFASHTLTDFLRADVGPILIHVKEGGVRIDALMAALRAHDALKTSVMGVQQAADAVRVKELSPETEVLAFMPRLEYLPEFLAGPADNIRLWEGWVTEELVAAIHAAGKHVWVMANNDACGGGGYTTAENLRLWREMGIDGVLVNDPAAARAALS